MIKSLDTLKADFISCGYGLSSVGERVLHEEVDIGDASVDYRLQITRAAIQTYREWTEEWERGWRKGCFASLPVLSFAGEWFGYDRVSPVLNIIPCSEDTQYEPGDFVLALPSNNLPEFLEQVYLGGLGVHRQSEGSDWLIWSSDAVGRTLKETPSICSSIPKSEQPLFLLRLLRNLSLISTQFCPLTRGISRHKTDSRTGALSEMSCLITEQLILEHWQKEGDFPALLKILVEIAQFAGCEYVLFDALQGIVA